MEKKYGNYKGEKCQYCQGEGYFQLLLGGSETCDHCAGSGEDKK
jgi:DnaJ-class molecular chaperone